MEFDGGATVQPGVALARPGIATACVSRYRHERPSGAGNRDASCSRLGRRIIYRRARGISLRAAISVSLPAGNPEAYLEALAVPDYATALEAGRNGAGASVPLADLHEGLRGRCPEVSVRPRRVRVPFPVS